MTEQFKFDETAAEEISKKLESSGLLLSANLVSKIFPIALDELLKMLETDSISIMKVETGEHEFIYAYTGTHFLHLFVDGILTKSMAEYLYFVFAKNYTMKLQCYGVMDSFLWYGRRFVYEHSYVDPNTKESKICELIVNNQFSISSKITGEYMAPNRYSYVVKISRIKSYKS